MSQACTKSATKQSFAVQYSEASNKAIKNGGAVTIYSGPADGRPMAGSARMIRPSPKCTFSGGYDALTVEPKAGDETSTEFDIAQSKFLDCLVIV